MEVDLRVEGADENSATDCGKIKNEMAVRKRDVGGGLESESAALICIVIEESGVVKGGRGETIKEDRPAIEENSAQLIPKATNLEIRDREVEAMNSWIDQDIE
jgi:hypothetical protein